MVGLQSEAVAGWMDEPPSVAWAVHVAVYRLDLARCCSAHGGDRAPNWAGGRFLVNLPLLSLTMVAGPWTLDPGLA
jgi:hypothetical protein